MEPDVSNKNILVVFFYYFFPNNDLIIILQFSFCSASRVGTPVRLAKLCLAPGILKVSSMKMKIKLLMVSKFIQLYLIQMEETHLTCNLFPESSTFVELT
jgi:hypothetical protein